MRVPQLCTRLASIISLKGKGEGYDGDQIYFQATRFTGNLCWRIPKGRISKEQIQNFRREFAEGGGLSSYPHPWLVHCSREFPTVSMGLGPIMAIYQARFNRYLEDRGLKKDTGSKVWAFLGDGETDEPKLVQSHLLQENSLII